MTATKQESGILKIEGTLDQILSKPLLPTGLTPLKLSRERMEHQLNLDMERQTYFTKGLPLELAKKIRAAALQATEGPHATNPENEFTQGDHIGGAAKTIATFVINDVCSANAESMQEAQTKAGRALKRSHDLSFAYENNGTFYSLGVFYLEEIDDTATEKKSLLIVVVGENTTAGPDVQKMTCWCNPFWVESKDVLQKRGLAISSSESLAEEVRNTVQSQDVAALLEGLFTVDDCNEARLESLEGRVRGIGFDDREHREKIFQNYINDIEKIIKDLPHEIRTLIDADSMLNTYISGMAENDVNFYEKDEFIRHLTTINGIVKQIISSSPDVGESTSPIKTQQLELALDLAKFDVHNSYKTSYTQESEKKAGESVIVEVREKFITSRPEEKIPTYTDLEERARLQTTELVFETCRKDIERYITGNHNNSDAAGLPAGLLDRFDENLNILVKQIESLRLTLSTNDSIDKSQMRDDMNAFLFKCRDVTRSPFVGLSALSEFKQFFKAVKDQYTSLQEQADKIYHLTAFIQAAKTLRDKAGILDRKYKEGLEYGAHVNKIIYSLNEMAQSSFEAQHTEVLSVCEKFLGALENPSNLPPVLEELNRSIVKIMRFISP